MCIRPFGLMAAFIIVSYSGCSHSERPTGADAAERQDDQKSGFMANTPEPNAKDVADVLASNPQVRKTAVRLQNKDDFLTEFQKANGISVPPKQLVRHLGIPGNRRLSTGRLRVLAGTVSEIEVAG